MEEKVYIEPKHEESTENNLLLPVGRYTLKASGVNVLSAPSAVKQTYQITATTFDIDLEEMYGDTDPVTKTKIEKGENVFVIKWRSHGKERKGFYLKIPSFF